MGMWSPVYNGTANNMWFGYDPLGRCVKRWVAPWGAPSTNATYYYYDGWNLIQEGPSGGTDRVYVHGGRTDEIVASQAGGVWSFHQYDARGHCIMLTDTSGLIREQYDYDAFGLPYFYNGTGAKLGASFQWGNRFLFTGREWLKDLKVYDYRNRMYQPELGRFLQPDPKQFEAGDYNIYRYCHNDPVNRSDPFGLETKIYPGGESEWAANYNPTDRTVLVAHGNPRQGAVDTVNNKIITASTLAKDAIKAGFSESKPKVDLAICGGGVGGKNSLAQKVANELASRTGVKPDVGGVDGNTALTGKKGDVTGKVTSDPIAGKADATKGYSGKVIQFTAEPTLKKDK
jgi:RHS repeat-associated protein